MGQDYCAVTRHQGADASVDYASLQPCCSLYQLELYSALSLDYAVVVAMSCFCMCYATQ